MTRVLRLGDSLDPSHIEADFSDGVLTVTIGVVAQAQPRKVAIGSGTRPDADD